MHDVLLGVCVSSSFLRMVTADLCIITVVYTYVRSCYYPKIFLMERYKYIVARKAKKCTIPYLATAPKSDLIKSEKKTRRSLGRRIAPWLKNVLRFSDNLVSTIDYPRKTPTGSSYRLGYPE